MPGRRSGCAICRTAASPGPHIRTHIGGGACRKTPGHSPPATAPLRESTIFAHLRPYSSSPPVSLLLCGVEVRDRAGGGAQQHSRPHLSPSRVALRAAGHGDCDHRRSSGGENWTTHEKNPAERARPLSARLSLLKRYRYPIRWCFGVVRRGRWFPRRGVVVQRSNPLGLPDSASVATEEARSPASSSRRLDRSCLACRGPRRTGRFVWRWASGRQGCGETPGGLHLGLRLDLTFSRSRPPTSRSASRPWQSIKAAISSLFRSMAERERGCALLQPVQRLECRSRVIALI